MNNENRLGMAIKTARKNKNYSQEQLAELLEITATHLKHIESGHRKPSVDVLFKAAYILNMSVDSVVFENENNSACTASTILLMLKKCTEKELNILSDLLNSMLRNREGK